MFSSTLALFTRSLRVDARSTRPHLLRLLFAFVILLQLIWMHEMEVLYGAPGLTMFKWISWLNFVLITLAGIGYFATAISEEKEEDSLGLLKMAGISPVALLLGKSTTRLIAVLLMLAVEFPFVLLSITLGGVTMTQIIAMAVALAAYLIFIANLGLACSVICDNSRRASTLTTLSLIVILIVLPLLGVAAMVWLAAYSKDTPTRQVVASFATWEKDLSMWYRITTIQSTGFSESAWSRQVICHLAAALGLFGLSWAGFERFTRESHAARPLETFFARPFRRLRRRTIGRAWPLALTWKDFYFVAGGKRMAIVRFVLYLAIIGGVFRLTATWVPYPRRFQLDVLGDTAMMTMLCAAAVEISLIASRVFRDEVKAQTLPLLMMLPKTTAQIVWSKAASAVPTMAPTLCLFFLGALLHIESFAAQFEHLLTSWAGWYGMVWFVLFLHLAAYLSLVVKWGALPQAIFLVFFCQMFLFLIVIPFSWLLFRFSISNEHFTMFCLTLIGLAGIAVLEYQIPRRLKQLAGR
jgi:ABC-type transport system involved in multi-copper enzyme maturation permease subunit